MVVPRLAFQYKVRNKPTTDKPKPSEQTACESSNQRDKQLQQHQKAPASPVLKGASPQPAPENPEEASNAAEPQKLDVPMREGRRKPKRKGSRTPLPPDANLRQVVERGLKQRLDADFTEATDEERARYQNSMEQVLACLDELTAPTEACYRPNAENTELEKREAQLSAIVAKYTDELKLWEELKDEAKEGTLGDKELPPAAEEQEVEFATDVADVLQTSTKVVEKYILQADHLRTLLKQLESRNRITQSRVREIASSVNNKVLTELGGTSSDKLVPPAGLTAVRTNELKVSTMQEPN